MSANYMQNTLYMPELLPFKIPVKQLITIKKIYMSKIHAVI